MKTAINKEVTETADEYIAAAAPEKQAMLKQVRQIIKKEAPKATEMISYQVVCYNYLGMLIGFGAHKVGCSLYTMSTTLPKEFAKRYKDLEYSHSTIHFSLKKPLPVAMIKKIVKLKVKMNEEKAAIKQLTKAATKKRKK